MNVVDSSAWIEYFAGGARTEALAPVIEDVQRLVVPTVCLLEVFKFTLRERGEQEALQVIASMKQARIVPLDECLALEAARLGVQHRLPLADSVILATARAHDAVVWTLDSHFAGVEGVRYLGSQPSPA